VGAENDGLCAVLQAVFNAGHSADTGGVREGRVRGLGRVERGNGLGLAVGATQVGAEND
jgi:hypothetical protein